MLGVIVLQKQEEEEEFFPDRKWFCLYFSHSLSLLYFFPLLHLKLFAYLFFKGNFTKCYSPLAHSLAISQGNQRNESKKGKNIDRKINFFDEGWKFFPSYLISANKSILMALFCILYVAKKRKLRIIEKFVVNNFILSSREGENFVKMLSINFLAWPQATPNLLLHVASVPSISFYIATAIRANSSNVYLTEIVRFSRWKYKSGWFKMGC